jgi:hypothetical protein
VDSACAYTDLWLYDLPNGCEDNINRLLCVRGAGILNLDTIPYNNTQAWSTALQEYSPGTENGDLFLRGLFMDDVLATFSAPQDSYLCYDELGNMGIRVELLN